jgi:hypothetical protein
MRTAIPIDRGQRSQNLSFEQFAWQWFEQYVIPNNKYSEQYAKQKILTSNLVPFFGKMPLRGINPPHLALPEAAWNSIAERYLHCAQIVRHEADGSACVAART